jgi:endonuclease IV
LYILQLKLFLYYINQQKMSIGIHLNRSAKGNFSDALGIELGDCCQIFTHGPRSMTQSKTISEESLKELCSKKRVYVHQTYCTSWETKGAWHMRDQYQVAKRIGARGLVLHLAMKSPKQHIDFLESLGEPFKDLGCPFILEMRALKPDQPWTYQSPREINLLVDEIKSRGYKPSDICICLDTAHLSAGKQTIATAQQAGDWIEAIEDWDYIGLLHLNGNEYDPLVRAGDKHTIPGCCMDKIWGSSSAFGLELDKEVNIKKENKKEGYKEFIDWHVKEQKKDCIVEVDWSPTLVDFFKSIV